MYICIYSLVNWVKVEQMCRIFISKSFIIILMYCEMSTNHSGAST